MGGVNQVLLYSGSLATTFAVHVLVPLLPLLQDELGLSYISLGVLSSTAAVSMLAADLSFSNASSHLNPKSLLMLALTMSVLGSLVGFLAPGLPLLLLARVATGFGFSLALTLGMVGIGRRKEGTGGAIRLAGLDTSLMIGRSAAPMLSGLLAASLGWRASFAAATVLAAVVLLLGWLCLKGTRGAHGGPVGARHLSSANEESSTPTGSDRKLSTAAAWFLSYLYFALIFTRVGTVAFLLPLLGHDVLSFDVEVLGIVLGASSLLTIAMIMPGAAFTRIAGRRSMVLFGLVTTGLALILLGNVVSRPAFVLGLLLLPMNAASVSLTWASFVRLSNRLKKPNAIGLFRLAGDGGAVLGPLLLGIVAKSSLGLAFSVNAALLLPAIAFASWRRLYL